MIKAFLEQLDTASSLILIFIALDVLAIVLHNLGVF